MVEDRLQFQRFELKYTLHEARALAVREFVRMYLEIDEFGATRPNLSYPVHSLYLDSDDLTTYWETINGTKNRFKLRLRFYDDKPTAPVFFEIKRRVNDAILKQRGAVRREAVDWLLAGHLPEPDHLLSNDPRQLVALQRFSELMNRLHAKPKAHVSYLREAWISADNNSVRVTMDRAVQCAPEPTPRVSVQRRDSVAVFGRNVILELKFTGRFPNWFGELVRAHNLVQCASAKYAEGVTLIGEERFTSRAFLAQLPDTTAHGEVREASRKKGANAGWVETPA